MDTFRGWRGYGATVLVACCALQPAAAGGTDTLPRPYTAGDLETEGVAQYRLSPVPGVTLPHVPTWCESETPSEELLVGPDGQLTRTPHADGSGAPALFVDQHLPISQVMAAIGTADVRVLGVTAPLGMHPARGMWCGVALTLVPEPGRRPVFRESERSLPKTRRRMLREVKAGRAPLLAVHPDTPWADVLAWSVTAAGIPVLALDPEAAPFPTYGSLAVATEPPTGTLVGLTTPEGQPWAHFESPTRLVHTSGQTLAMYDDGVIFVRPQEGMPSAFEADIVAHPSVAPRVPWMYVLEDGGMWSSREHETPYQKLGAVEGEPDEVQRAMLALGAVRASDSAISIESLARAEADGTATVAGHATARTAVGAADATTGGDAPLVLHSDVHPRRSATPQYPPDAVGQVAETIRCPVLVSIDTEGAPTSAHAGEDCHPLFVESAQTAAMQMRWYPYRVNGVKTPARFHLNFVFRARMSP